MSSHRRFSTRRLPGTIALAITNLIAADVCRNPSALESSPIHVINVELLPARVWGALWLVAGIGLIVAAVTRRQHTLHLFGGLSLAVWSAISAGVITAWVTGQAHMTASGLALLWWMWAGVASMLLVPLIVGSTSNGEQ